MPVYRPKPPSPVWQPGKAPAGCKLYLPLCEYGSPAVRDLSGNGYNGTLVGAPAWQRGLYGPQLGSFSASNYVTADGAAKALDAGPPLWAAVCFTGLGSGTAVVVPFQFYNPGTSSEVTLYVQSGSSGSVGAFLNSPGTANANPTATGTAISDGGPHVLHVAALSGADVRLYLDGRQVASATPSGLGAFSGLYVNVGVQRVPAVSRVFPGSILAAAAGRGATPDPAALAADWLSGAFAAARPGNRVTTFPATSRKKTPPHLFTRAV